MKTKKTAQNPFPGNRRKKTTLAVGLLLVLVLIGGGVWGLSLAASNTPAGTPDATPADAARPPAATATSTSDSAPAVSATTVPGGTPSEPKDAPLTVPATEANGGGAATTGTNSSDAQLATVDQPIASSVALDRVAPIRDGVTAEISGLESVQGEAKKAGEVAGPAVRFTVNIKNSTAKALSTRDVVVNVDAGAQALPAITLSGPGVSAFPDAIEPGESGAATYVFRVPLEQRNIVRILVNFQVDSPIAAFEGAAPTEGRP